MLRLKCLKIKTQETIIKSPKDKANTCFFNSLFVSLAYELNMEDYSSKFRRADKRGLEIIR